MIDSDQLIEKKLIFVEADGHTVRPATTSEIIEAVMAGSRKEVMQQIIYLLQSNIDESSDSCPHVVCYDEGIIRTCVTCGKTFSLDDTVEVVENLK